jgi:hypothetical protein
MHNLATIRVSIVSWNTLKEKSNGYDESPLMECSMHLDRLLREKEQSPIYSLGKIKRQLEKCVDTIELGTAIVAYYTAVVNTITPIRSNTIFKNHFESPMNHCKCTYTEYSDPKEVVVEQRLAC